MPLPLIGIVAGWAIVVPIVVRILLALGIGIATYTGADFAITSAETYVFQNFNGLSVNMYSIAVLAGFHEGLKIMFAAFAAQITIKTTMGAFKRFTFA